jgi:hypothetical protein
MCLRGRSGCRAGRHSQQTYALDFRDIGVDLYHRRTSQILQGSEPNDKIQQALRLLRMRTSLGPLVPMT